MSQFDFDQDSPAPSSPKRSAAGPAVIIVGCCVFVVFALVITGAAGYGYYSTRAGASARQNEIALAKERKEKEADEARDLAAQKERERIAWKEQQEKIEQKYRKIKEDIDRANQREKESAERETFERKLQMEEDARRIGSLSKAEYIQAQRALEFVKKLGQPGFERVPADIKRRAAILEPRLIADMERILGALIRYPPETPNNVSGG